MKHPTSSSSLPAFPGLPARRLRLSVLVAAALLGQVVTAVGPAQAQVTYFDRPPTASELKRALTAGSAATARPSDNAAVAADPAAVDRPAGVRTRVIVWSTDGKTPDQGGRPAGAEASAKAPVTAPITNSPGPSAYAKAYEDRAAGPAAGMPINFASGSSQIDPSSTGFIRTVAELLNSDRSMSLVIEGHTDSIGRFERNMVLSWERAVGVYRMLVEQYGIAPARLAIIGKGSTEPMPGTTPEDSSNRRVQFRLKG